MKAATEAVYLPVLFFTVVLLGGVRVSDRLTFTPPPLFALVLGIMLFGVLIRGRVLAPERLMSGSRSAIANVNGFVVVIATYVAATQVFNLVIPESGLPFLLFNVFLFVLLVNTMAGSHDRVSVLRSLAVVTGAAFILKFVVLASLSEPGDTALKRVLLAMLEGVTLGTLTQPVLHPASGYLAFGTLLLFLIGVAMLPSPDPAQLALDRVESRRVRLKSHHSERADRTIR